MVSILIILTLLFFLQKLIIYLQDSEAKNFLYKKTSTDLNLSDAAPRSCFLIWEVRIITAA